MKILYIDFNMPYLVKDADYPIGGATVEWYAWIKGFEANNCEVGVLTWKGAEEYIKDNDSINFIESYDTNKGIKKLRLLYYRFPKLLIEVKNYKPDFIIQECAGAETGIMFLIAKILNIPFIHRVANDIDTDNRINKRLDYYQRIFFRYGLRNSSAIFCQNTYQFERIREILPHVKTFIIHIPYYHKTDLPKVKIHSERSYIAWMANFKYQKNLPALYEIIKKMPDLVFKIVGRNPTSGLDESSQKALEGLRKCNNVEFVGYLKRTEVLPFLAKAYALLNTSHYEGFSLSYLDALAVGTPIVTIRKNDPDDFISRNRVGAVSDDYSGLENLLNKIVHDPNYIQLVERCRLYVSENHAAEYLSRQFIENLKTIDKGD